DAGGYPWCWGTRYGRLNAQFSRRRSHPNHRWHCDKDRGRTKRQKEEKGSRQCCDHGWWRKEGQGQGQKGQADT
ncbi:hypothetical protein EV182_008934, partial [Spiromyces aspiralis]